MKKVQLATQGATSIAALALLTTLAQADSARYSDVSNLDIDMAHAAAVASSMNAGEIIEIELETENSKSVWELDIVNEANEVVTVEIDGYSGDILSIKADGTSDLFPIDVLRLSQAIDAVKAVAQGAIIEAELEDEHGALVWEVESIDAGNRQTKYRVNAETGEILS